MADRNEYLQKNMDMLESATDTMWDMWLGGLRSLSWTQDQIENMARTQLDQNKDMREEWLRLAEDLIKQMRANQGQIQSMFGGAMMDNYDPFSLIQAYAKQFEDIYKK